MNIANAIAPLYVLEDIKIDEACENKIEIVARQAGLISWIMAKLFKRILGMTFTVRSEGVALSDGWYRWIPMAKVANFGCGYTMNGLLQVLGIIALIAGLFTLQSVGWGLLCIAALLLYLYSRSRRFMISITACSGEGIIFGIKRGVIGGQTLAEKDADAVVNIIKNLVIAK